MGLPVSFITLLKNFTEIRIFPNKVSKPTNITIPDLSNPAELAGRIVKVGAVDNTSDLLSIQLVADNSLETITEELLQLQTLVVAAASKGFKFIGYTVPENPVKGDTWLEQKISGQSPNQVIQSEAAWFFDGVDWVKLDSTVKEDALVNSLTGNNETLYPLFQIGSNSKGVKLEHLEFVSNHAGTNNTNNYWKFEVQQGNIGQTTWTTRATITTQQGITNGLNRNTLDLTQSPLKLLTANGTYIRVRVTRVGTAGSVGIAFSSEFKKIRL